jgi:hypothetical protein
MSRSVDEARDTVEERGDGQSEGLRRKTHDINDTLNWIAWRRLGFVQPQAPRIVLENQVGEGPASIG